MGWGSVGVFPTEFDDKIAKNLATRCRDPRKSYALVISDDDAATRNVVVSFPSASHVWPSAVRRAARW